MRKNSKPRAKNKQRTYYVAAEYIDHGDRLLVQDGKKIELYSIDLKLAQHWYAAAWRGSRFNLEPFNDQCIAWEMEVEEAEQIKNSGLVLAECLRHGEGMPVVEEYNGHPIYGSAVNILIGEVFEAALGNLIEQGTGIAGLTISPMHTGYALHDGRPVGKASIDIVARSVVTERPNLALQTAPDGTLTILFSDIVSSTEINAHVGDARWRSCCTNKTGPAHDFTCGPFRFLDSGSSRKECHSNCGVLKFQFRGELELIQIQVRLEEDFLVKNHGVEYEQYRRQVRRWI